MSQVTSRDSGHSPFTFNVFVMVTFVDFVWNNDLRFLLPKTEHYRFKKM